MIDRLLHKLFGCRLFWKHKMFFNEGNVFHEATSGRVCSVCGKHQTWNELTEEWMK